MPVVGSQWSFSVGTFGQKWSNVTRGLKLISKLVLEKISEKSLERSAGNLGLKLELRLTLL